MVEHLAAAFVLLLDPYVLAVILGSALFGLFVGSIPGLSATMAVALLVPVTFFMPALPAVACMVTVTAMAIFAGDVPGALLRIPGTPASAAYCDESFAMTRKGQAEAVLGAGIVFSVIGGLFGTVVLILAAPALAEAALLFSSFEYFWLVMLGLTCAVFVSPGRPVKGLVSLMLGLLVASVGFENPAAYPRFTFGSPYLMSGVQLIPVMIGMFAISEVLRYAVTADRPIDVVTQSIGRVFAGQWTIVRRYPLATLRGSVLGTLVGALPGAGADIAAWMSYGISKRFSKTPEKFGTGHIEGIVEAGAANNSALAGAWIPALVFGIPGDSITAIVIGVLYLKGLNPGPTIFIENAASIYAVFLVFLLANLLLFPLGWLLIKAAKNVLHVPRNVLMPVILLFCVVGSFAINNSLFDVGVMLAFGVLAFVMEINGFPIAPTILGLVLGGMLEQNFVTSMIKADGNLFAFFERPVSGTLGVATILIWLSPLLVALWRRRRA
ncbi:MAG: tripartite tricarboxylate transporter permease [Acidobacteria bacterium]|nr:tripartite tricarboxylate transporter permease [Acidobacteriota bacterium]